LSGWDAGDGLESPLLDLGGDFLANFAVAGVELIEPGLAQRVDLLILGSAEPGIVAIGRERWIRPGVQHLGAKEICAKDVPATFPGFF
jgi:hypothetical protein